MKTLRNIITNPIAIAVSIMQWIVFILAILFDDDGGTGISLHRVETTLFKLMSLVNLPSFLITETIINQVFWIFGNNLLTGIFGYLIFIFCVTFQWLLIGYAVNLIYSLFKLKELKLSLND